MVECKLLITGLVGCVALSAENLSDEEISQWKKLGVPVYRVQEYTSQGITPSILKLWNDAGIGGQAISDYKANDINTPQEAKNWKDAGIGHSDDLRYIKRAKIKSPNELKSWKIAGISLYDISDWKEMGINDPKNAKEWKNVTDIAYVPLWKKAGVDNPKDVQYWKNANVSVYDVEKIKKANLDLDVIKAWKEYGVKDLESITKLKNGGFSTPKKYKPYKGMYIDHAIKLKQWDIEPNELIKSMSHSNKIFNQELYFTDEKSFKNAYKIIEEQCNVIVKDKWFTTVNMSQNEDQCYIFFGTMIRLH